MAAVSVGLMADAEGVLRPTALLDGEVLEVRAGVALREICSSGRVGVMGLEDGSGGVSRVVAWLATTESRCKPDSAEAISSAVVGSSIEGRLISAGLIESEG